MNPRTVAWQSVALELLLLATALVGAVVAALVLAGAGSLAWMALNAKYAADLEAQGRPKRRIAGDHVIAGCAAVGFLGPLFVAAALAACGYEQSPALWRLSERETAALVISAGALFTVLVLSSFVDWYYIRPRIDGVTRTPPCRSSGANWKRPTRRWFIHRLVATLAYMAFAGVVALIVMLMLVREDPAAAGVIGGVGGLAGILLIFAGRYRSQLPTVGAFINSPAYYLGDDLTFDPYRPSGRGFVLHVAVPVTKLVPLDAHGLPTGAAFIERKNSDLADAELVGRATTACNGVCRRLNPECVIGAPRRDRRRRWLVL